MRSSLADYQLLGPFGPGGEDDGTWLARSPERLGDDAGTVVLLELPDPGPAVWPEVVDRLSRLAMVDHEGLPRLIEAGRTEESDGVVAWASRTETSARPLRAPAEDRQQALQAVAAAARAAHALHEAGLAHGDIRPAALLGDGERVVLEPPLRPLVRPDARAGERRTAADLDPIDAAALWGEGPSRASDIWSLGATVHALVSGELLHPDLKGDGPVTAVQRILIEPPQVAEGLGEELEALVRRCLSPDPADRPATAADLAAELEQLAGDK
ncbi:MAG TPA: hypothetical protein VKV06_15155 [Acidimicrobiales bacterium]|nr:hypothetical protein [Acidimicrobiales bacterium]